MKNNLKHRNRLSDAKIQSPVPSGIEGPLTQTTSIANELLDVPLDNAPLPLRKRIRRLVQKGKTEAAEKLMIRLATSGPTPTTLHPKPITRRSEKDMDRWMIDLVYTLGILLTLIIMRWLLIGRT